MIIGFHLEVVLSFNPPCLPYPKVRSSWSASTVRRPVMGWHSNQLYIVFRGFDYGGNNGDMASFGSNQIDRDVAIVDYAHSNRTSRDVERNP